MPSHKVTRLFDSYMDSASGLEGYHTDATQSFDVRLLAQELTMAQTASKYKTIMLGQQSTPCHTAPLLASFKTDNACMTCLAPVSIDT